MHLTFVVNSLYDPRVKKFYYLREAVVTTNQTSSYEGLEQTGGHFALLPVTTSNPIRHSFTKEHS
jgi:hypothetical protein